MPFRTYGRRGLNTARKLQTTDTVFESNNAASVFSSSDSSLNISRLSLEDRKEEPRRNGKENRKPAAVKSVVKDKARKVNASVLSRRTGIKKQSLRERVRSKSPEIPDFSQIEQVSLVIEDESEKQTPARSRQCDSKDESACDPRSKVVSSPVHPLYSDSRGEETCSFYSCVQTSSSDVSEYCSTGAASTRSALDQPSDSTVSSTPAVVGSYKSVAPQFSPIALEDSLFADPEPSPTASTPGERMGSFNLSASLFSQTDQRITRSMSALSISELSSVHMYRRSHLQPLRESDEGETEEDESQADCDARRTSVGRSNLTHSSCEQSHNSSYVTDSSHCSNNNDIINRNSSENSDAINNSDVMNIDISSCSEGDTEKRHVASPSDRKLRDEEFSPVVSITPMKPAALRHFHQLQKANKSFEILSPVRCRKSQALISAADKVMFLCEQTDPIPFDDFLPRRQLVGCKKLGEGVYGEVYTALDKQRQPVALKVIPIEGDKAVNDEPQKTFEGILPEIRITRELSDLRKCPFNNTSSFVGLKRVMCVRGEYNKTLLDAWDVYADRKCSENDRPDIFDENQLFIVFIFENAGQPFETFQFNNRAEAMSVLYQTTCALAVAERALQFEHRDLHWGNVLLKPTDDTFVEYELDDEIVTIETIGLKVSVIDFTLSRLCKDGLVSFTDLNTDPDLFNGEGDIQFDIYRHMKQELKSDWKTFCAKTNVMWLGYMCDKIRHAKSFKSSQESRKHMKLLRDFEKLCKTAKSSVELVSLCR